MPDGFLFGNDTAKINIKKRLLNEFNLHLIVRLPSSVFAPYTSITTNILFFEKVPQGTQRTWFYRLDMPSGYKHFSKTKPMKLEHFDEFFEWNKDRREIVIDNFPKAKCYSNAQLADEFAYNLDLCGYPHEEEEILAPNELIQRYEEERASLNTQIDSILEQIKASIGG